MSSNTINDFDFLLQKDVRHLIEYELPQQQWLTLHHFWFNKQTHGGVFCGILPNQLIEEALKHSSWDFNVRDNVGPGCIQYFEKEKEVTEYFRFGDRGGIEPLIIPRKFHGIRPDYIEVLEEFRLFHRLYWDHERGVYLKFDDAGNSHEVVRVKPGNIVEVSKLHIRQFLALKSAALMIFFDYVRYSKIEISSVPKIDRRVEIKTDIYCYHLHLIKDDPTPPDEWQSFSRLCGKHVILPLPQEESNFWPFHKEPEDYCEFIIGVDENDKPIRYNCNHEKLANHFGANPKAPHYLTPVFFRKDVLSKYYANPSLYSVEDGYLRCGTLWGISIDNNLTDHVVVYLGDLGRDLPASERPYWQSSNTLPQGSISKTSRSRDFMAEFADPERIDLCFRYRYDTFNTAWTQKFSWPFFLPLHDDEQYLLRTIRSLLNDSQSEFDSQVLALTKLLVDSLNEKELAKSISGHPLEAKGIDKLETFLSKNKFPRTKDVVSLLRDLQDIRSSGSAHRKGSRYERVMEKQGLAKRSLPLVFDDLLKDAIDAIDTLVDFFLLASTNDTTESL